MKTNARVGTAKLLAGALAGALLVAAVPGSATAEEWVCPHEPGTPGELKLGTGKYVGDPIGTVELEGDRYEALYLKFELARLWYVQNPDNDETDIIARFELQGRRAITFDRNDQPLIGWYWTDCTRQ